MFAILKQLSALLMWLPLAVFGAVVEITPPDEEMPELSDVQWLVTHPKPGVVFTIREYDEEALEWTSERAQYYLQLLRKAHPKMPVVFLSHGDEVGSLKTPVEQNYRDLHQRIQSWVNDYDVIFHVCNTMARMLGISEDSFPVYIDVVPFGPSQLQDYLELGYEHIELELTW